MTSPEGNRVERNLRHVYALTGATDDVRVYGRWAIDWRGPVSGHVLIDLSTDEMGGTRIAQGMNRKNADRIGLAMQTADELMRIWD